VEWRFAEAAEVPADDGWLGARERATLAALRPGPRRDSWRLGRFAAKRLLGADVEVIAGDGGAPRAFRGERAAARSVSISHRAGVALCAAAVGAVGCDLELVEARSEAFVGDFFTAGEAAWVARAADRALAANLVWSAKESALKALGVGLRRDTRGVEVTVDGSRLRVRDLEAGGEWRGVWWRRHDLVATILHSPQA
jgi:4'-phosphopantetheinyl transferase